MILLVRHELPVAVYDRSRLYTHLFIDVAWSDRGAIYRDDHAALEALKLVSEALDQPVTVQVIEQ